MIDLTKVGAFAAVPALDGLDVRFGIYLPGIMEADGYEITARVIHSDDRFNPAILPIDFALHQIAGDPYNLWGASVHIPLQAGTKFGQSGTYLYRYKLSKSGVTTPIIPFVTDPFARATDVGDMAAFTTADLTTAFDWQDDQWKVPGIEDLIVYELHVEEFNTTFDGVVERLPYLRSLGVNCLELMPVTSLKLDFDWGYGPLYYFAPCHRWGGPDGLKRLVRACHQAGVAVIFDVVYQHVDPRFPYHYIYDQINVFLGSSGNIPSPMTNGTNDFGVVVDYSQPFARDYVQAANAYWLTDFHVDGFRYDEVTDMYDGPLGVKYPKMAYDAYTLSLTIPRFTPSGGQATGEYSRIIQCPEALGSAPVVMRNTYSNAAWQDGLLNLAEDILNNTALLDDGFAHQLDANWSGYPLTKTVVDKNGQPVDMPVAPFQYLQSHDHSQIVWFIGTQPDFVWNWQNNQRLLTVPAGDRSRYYKLQPYVVALYTCEGVPMLFQGQELADDYVLPNAGNGRVYIERNMHWEYFYDAQGTALIRLYRILGGLRRNIPALRSRQSYYYYLQSRPGDGIIAYSRQSTAPSQTAMVVLNFTDATQTISPPFPQAGTYREMVDDRDRPAPLEITIGTAQDIAPVTVPPNYGYVFVS